MEIGEIWATIIIPIVIGPLFLLFKTMWDRNNSFKYEKAKMQFEEKKNKLQNQLNLFYYPVYLKLVLIYSLSFSLPERKLNKTEDENDKPLL